MGIAAKAKEALADVNEGRHRPADRSEHMLATYFWLRQCVAWLGVLLPVVLLVVGWTDGDLKDSMSAYYYYESPWVRDIFVGVLVAIAALLFAYKGFSDGEDIWLNLAALLLVGVALRPMPDPGCESDCVSPTLHGTFAIGFFFCIAIVVLHYSSTTLSLLNDKGKMERLKAIYKGLGWAMALLPFIAWSLHWFKLHEAIFFVEALGVWVFSAYWFLKTYELQQSEGDKKVIDRTPVTTAGERDSFSNLA